MVTAPEPGLVLALDQGGHASRAVLFDSTGSEVAAAQVPVATRRDVPGFVEQDPLELVRSLRCAAEDACGSKAAAGRPVVAAGLATQRSTVVCWQKSTGHALTPAISWQDRRNAAWLERLRPHSAEIRSLTGLVLSPHYGASKLRWCLDHVPGVQRAAAARDLAFGPLASFLLSSLLDERPCVADPANASRTLLYDPSKLGWSQPLLDAFGIDRACLPACVPTRHTCGHLSVGSRRIPVTACTGDQSAAALAFGAARDDIALVNAGTGAFVQRPVPRDAALPDGLLRSVLSSDDTRAVYSHEGTVNGAGSAIDWLASRVALDVERALRSLSVDPGDSVPLFMNGVGGLGAPWWIADFPTEFVGEAADKGWLAAVVESIAFLLAANLEAMSRSAPLQRVRMSGGLAGCDYLCQALADASGLAVERSAVRETTALGTAFLAAGEPQGWRPAHCDRTFAPREAEAIHARHARWREEMARRGAHIPPA